MEQQTLIEEVRAYCEKSGISPSTLAVRVLGNSRYFDRLERRIEKGQRDAQALRDFMHSNPPTRAAS